MKTLMFPMALLALAAAQNPARADEFTPETRTVSYGDLDLTQAHDLATLHNRISRAIVRVCGDPAPTNLHMLALSARCRKETARRMEIRVAQVVRGQRGVADAGMRRAHVQIADLDLGRARDRRLFSRRLAQAVAQACDGSGPAASCRAQLRHQLPVMDVRIAADGAGPITG